MSFINEIKQRAKEQIKTIVLPESNDIRVLKAVDTIVKEKFANIILIGDETEIEKVANQNGLDIRGTKIINPHNFEKHNEYANALFELRKAKGMTIEKAKELLLNETYLGMMIVKQGDADGLVSGAYHSTADTLRPALQILKTAPNTKLVSSFFVMIVPNCSYGENGIFVFSDCGLVEKPNAEELAEIAKSSSKSFEQLIGNLQKLRCFLIQHTEAQIQKIHKKLLMQLNC